MDKPIQSGTHSKILLIWSIFLTTTVFEREVANLIVNLLELEVQADEIDPKEPLFYDGLGLDSIDALELSLEIGKRYGLQIKSDDEENEKIFANLRALAGHIEHHRPT